MGAIQELIGEMLMIVVAVAVFIAFAGIRIACSNCGARFYHHHKICPDCGQDTAADSSEEGETSGLDEKWRFVVRDEMSEGKDEFEVEIPASDVICEVDEEEDFRDVPSQSSGIGRRVDKD